MSINTDYLIIGGGASGMAFADTLCTHTNAKITIVDRGHSPGGHWNHAYPFVRLHQPSSFYGVPSKELGCNEIDTVGGNKGLYELASGSEVRGYFQQVLDQKLLPTGRVRYFGNSEYRDDGSIYSKVSGKAHDVSVRIKTVDTGYMGGAIPATHTRKFDVNANISCVSPSQLAEVQNAAAQYVIIGSGKTGIDVCLWLLDQGVRPDQIVWVMPRDAWFIDRRGFQPTADFYDDRLHLAVKENEAIIAAGSFDDLFDRLEHAGSLMRLDRDIKPTAYKCATVTMKELEALRRIKNIVRLGHLKQIFEGQLVLENGVYATRENAIHVDCSATGIPKVNAKPIYDNDRIHVQCVRTCQPTFSAALIAYIEVVGTDDTHKNSLSVPIPYPTDDKDWISQKLISGQNQLAWVQNEIIRNWLKECRLDVLKSGQSPSKRTAEQDIMALKLKNTFFAAYTKLQSFADDMKVK
jgi:hypothetical protein